MVPTGQVAEKQACEEPRQDRELKSWRCLVFYLCFFGFMAQLRPGESFITPYLLQQNFTIEQACCCRRVGEQWCGLGVLSWFGIWAAEAVGGDYWGQRDWVGCELGPTLTCHLLQ